MCRDIRLDSGNALDSPHTTRRTRFIVPIFATLFLYSHRNLPRHSWQALNIHCISLRIVQATQTVQIAQADQKPPSRSAAPMQRYSWPKPACRPLARM